ncbi:hypothetical protein MMC30_009343 [Trapelia coarctata]|nr:hypothetical protein [Trapelia coarctata]
MHFLPGLLLITTLFLLDLVSAAPTKTQLQPRSFKVKRHRVGKKHRHPVNALIKAYAKYNVAFEGVPFMEQVTGNSSGTTGKVTNTPTQGDVEFLSPVEIGGQTVQMNFDTGSSDFWVFNTNLPPSQQKGHSLYDPWTSPTWKNLEGYNFSIGYGDGSGSSGFVGTDVVNVGGATVTSQAMGLPTHVSGRIRRDEDSDGIMGLAFSSLNTIQPKPQLTFFDSVRGSLAEPVLTANLKHNATGFYEFGRIDHSLYQGGLSWVGILEDGYWKFTSPFFGVGSDPHNLQLNTKPSPAIADTGTSLMLVDDLVRDAYYSAVPNAVKDPKLSNSTTYPCDTQLPDFHVSLGLNYMATIPGNMMTFADMGDGNCYGALQSNAGLSVQIYGDTLFKSQVAVFHNGNNSIGFAPHAGVPGVGGYVPYT